MTDLAQTLLVQALDLPEDARAALAAALLKSLEPPPDAGVDKAWREEVARRVAALDAGEMETIPWEEVRDRLYARLSAKRKI